VWRHWLKVNAELPAALHRELQADAGLSLPDYDVMAQLTDTSTGRIRIGDLARALAWERSRLSHHLTRMEHRGLISREGCTDDGRGAFVVLTPFGRKAIERAAPRHVDAVRCLMFSTLTRDELTTLATVLDKILTRLDDRHTGGSS